MFKSDVINFYGTKAKVAKAAGVDPSAVSQWQELVPEGRAMRLPTTLARRHVQKLVPDLTDYQWYKGYADVIGKLVTKCWQEEAYAEAQLRKVTR